MALTHNLLTAMLLVPEAFGTAFVSWLRQLGTHLLRAGSDDWRRGTDLS